MLKTTLAGLRARKARLMLTATAVVLGVAFVAGTLIITGTVKAAFFDRFAAEARHVDASVEPPARSRGPQPRLPAATLAAVRRVPGAASVEGRITGTTALLNGSGGLIASGSAPGTAIDVPADPRFRTFTVTRGLLPRSSSEALLDADTAAHEHVRAGDSVTVLGPQQAHLTLRITGIMDLGLNKQLDSSGAPVIALPADGVRAVTGVTGYDRIDVAAAPGVGQARLAAQVRAAIGTGTVVVTGARLAHDLADGVTHQADLFLEGMLIFGLVALLVATLVIYNTFKILIAQRMRELALLRCVGATRRQVFTSVIIEAFAVGSAGSVTGVIGGVGLALGMPSLLNLTGAGIPSGPLVVSPAVIAIGLAAGIAVSVAAALPPAILATRVAPMAALRVQPEGRIGDVSLRTTRIIGAVALVASGTAMTAAGIPHGRGGLPAVAAGGCVFFLGALTAGPLLVAPLTAMVGGLPRRLGGVPARLAVAGLRRNPGRTSTTMIALTIGVGLMTLFSVVLATAGRFATDQMDQNYPVDYVITSVLPDTTIPGSLAVRLRGRPEIATAAELRVNERGRVNGTVTSIAALDPSAYQAAYRPRLKAGKLDGLRSGQIALYEAEATRLGAHVGSAVSLATSKGASHALTVVAIYASKLFGEEALISWTDYLQTYGAGGDDTVLVLARHGVTPQDSRAALDQTAAGLPLLRIDSMTAYKVRLNSAIDQITALLGALLATAVLIALFGIANTLSLSVLERTRESALLRALGLTRAQLRRTLAVEALLIGLMGGLVGIALGVAFGWAVSLAFLHDSGGGQVAFPVVRIIGYLALAALAGLLAAIVPARKAARTAVVVGLAAE